MTVRKSPPRPRNAAATRDAILRSAREAFVQFGYDGAGVRDIAKGAGVTAMLVNRYFGSKEKLFAEVLVSIANEPTILTPEFLATGVPSQVFAKALVGLTTTGATPLDGFQIMAKSAASARAAELGRESIDGRTHKRLASALKGPHPDERAALILALVAGFQVMRQVIGLRSLASASPDTLAQLLEPMLRTLIEGQPVT